MWGVLRTSSQVELRQFVSKRNENLDREHLTKRALERQFTTSEGREVEASIRRLFVEAMLAVVVMAQLPLGPA